MGLKPPPENFMVTARIVGIAAIESTLSPCDSLSTRSATDVLTPLLVWSVRILLVVLVTVDPPIVRLKPALLVNWIPPSVQLSVDVSTTPDHWVCHEFQTVPRLFLSFAMTAS